MRERETLVLVRLGGEVAIKSRRTRRRFVRRLIHNLEDALRAAGVEFELREEWGRLFVTVSDPEALSALARVFGIASISPIDATCDARLQEIVRVGSELYGDRVDGKSFAVRARRVGSHDFSSRDINYDLGAALDERGYVDLDDPEVTVGVEVRDEDVYFFSRRIAGPGGLPLGVEGRAVGLISGGYDSAVASWMMLSRGIHLDYVFCNMAGPAYERGVIGVAKRLADRWSAGSAPRLHVVEFEDVVRALKGTVREKYWQIVLKRLMYRAAERVAREVEAYAVVTGESVGQVSSQTLPNLVAISDCIELPVLRPLVGVDKESIVARSRAIGTYALSEKIQEHCALVGRKPATDATTGAVNEAEAGLDMAVLDEAVAARREVDLRDLSPSDAALPYLFTGEIPDDAVVIDTRSRAQFETWHLSGSQHRPFWELFRSVEELAPDVTYVLVCERGVESAQLADKMQRHGLEAYSFKGGVSALRERADRDGPVQATRTP